ncbi:MAG: transcriptional repressor LexA [Spirochaetales bacterium]|nr:transcriptional repressor LexA [Spirochaetales bacterium]
MKTITKRQDEVLGFMKDFLLRNKFPPTIREIANHFEISVKGAYEHVKALEKTGIIHCNQNQSRSIEILEDVDEERLLTTIPILGRVAAGLPILAEENLDGSVHLPQEFLGRGSHFALRVKGDSMTGAGIMDGDLAVIRSQNSAENGDIVVAMTEDDAVTLKRFFKERTRIKLQSENPAYNPLFLQNVRLLGKLVSVIRRYE